MSTRTAFDTFLMLDLKDVKEEFPDVSMRAYALLTTLAAGGDCMDESLLRGYIHEAEIPEELLVDYLAYFSGMNLFSVVCDCLAPDGCGIISAIQNVWFEKGRNSLIEQDAAYEKVRSDILELKEALEI